MGREERDGRLYYYRRKRDGRRVISEYVGGGELGELAEAMDALERLERESERAYETAAIEADRAVARDQDQMDGLVRLVTHAVLLVAGCHTHRGQWRRKRT